MLKDVTETSNGYSIKKDNAVLETNGFTLEFNANWSIIGINFNQTFTIKGSGDKDKPDLVIGQLWVNSGNEEVDKNKGLFLYDVYLKNSHEWYDTLLFSPCHLYIENCKIDTVPKYGENKKKQNAIYIRNNGGEGVAEFYGENILVGDIKVGVNATETVYGSLKFIDGSLKKEILFFPDLYGVENSILSTIELPSNWEWVEPNKAIIVENWEPITTIKEQARFNIPQDQYDYSGNDGYDKDNNCINKQVYITVLKANEWVMYPDIEEWIYGEEPKTPTATAKYGTAKFVYCDKEDGIYTEEAPTNPGTYYLKGIVEADYMRGQYSGLESDPIEFKIFKKISSINFDEGADFNKTYDGNQVTVSDEFVNKTGSTGNVSFMFEKKEDDGWVSLSEAPSGAGTYRVKAILNEDDEYATATSTPVEFTITKANTKVTITSILDKIYDGNKVNEPTYQSSGSTGLVSVDYQEYKNNKWSDLSKAPTNVGKYKVVVKVDEDTNYNSASDTKEFTISKADNTWTNKLSIKNWVYGESANTPTAKSKFGDVVFSYSDKKDGTYTSAVPTKAGTYYVKAEVIGNENYTGLESVVSFEILKADPVLKNLDTLTIEEGKALKSLSLPEGYEWKNPNYECKDLGTYTYKAVYTPKDSVNYNVLDVEVSVKVIAKSVETSPVVTPSITNNNNNTNHTYNGNGTSSTSSALKELSEVVSKSEYKAYEKAYTKESYDNYLSAYKVAEEVLNNKNSSKEEIKVALEKLNEAILNLKVDKTNLESSLAEFEKLDADKYSEASYIKLKDALDKAKSVMEDKETSAEEIARAIDELNEAYSSLQAVEPTVTEPEKTSVGKLALITTVATVTVVGGGSYLWILLKRSRGMK